MSTISKTLPNMPTNFSTTLTGNISSSAVTIGLDSVSGLSTSEGVGVIYAKDADGVVVDSSIEFIHWTGVSGSNITLTDTGDRGIAGSTAGAVSHATGDTFEVWTHPEYHFYDFAVVEHNADGTHSDITVDSVVVTGDVDATTVTTPTITDSNGNEAIKVVTTPSAVNEFTFTNAATGNAPSITATGGDTDIDLNLAGKGAGDVFVPFNIATATSETDTDVGLSFTDITGMSVSVTTRKAAKILILVTEHVYFNNAYPNTDHSMRIYETTTASAVGREAYTYYGPLYAGNGKDEQISIHRFFSAASAGTYTFQLQGKRSDTSATARFSGGDITAIVFYE